MNKKWIKTAALVGAAYVGYKLLKGENPLAGLKGLADDFIPSDVEVPYTYTSPYYGIPPYGQPYAGAQFPGSYFQLWNYPTPAMSYPPMMPPAPGYQYNPFGGQSYYGQYIPKIVTPSGGIQGLRGRR